METIYDFKALTSKGKELDFSQFEGKVLLIVNTASKCGFTPQFAGLEELNKKYKDRGLVVIGFPSGDFANQELADGSKAEEFCQLNYGVTFQIMKKSDVNGADANPIFTYLKSQKGFTAFDLAHPLGKLLDDMLRKQDANYDKNPDIKWNFTKFLIDRKGNVVKRFEPTDSMEGLEEDIKKTL